jgi:hypothetical protein
MYYGLQGKKSILNRRATALTPLLLPTGQPSAQRHRRSPRIGVTLQCKYNLLIIQDSRIFSQAAHHHIVLYMCFVLAD